MPRRDVLFEFAGGAAGFPLGGLDHRLDRACAPWGTVCAVATRASVGTVMSRSVGSASAQSAALPMTSVVMPPSTGPHLEARRSGPAHSPSRSAGVAGELPDERPASEGRQAEHGLRRAREAAASAGTSAILRKTSPTIALLARAAGAFAIHLAEGVVSARVQREGLRPRARPRAVRRSAAQRPSVAQRPKARPTEANCRDTGSKPVVSPFDGWGFFFCSGIAAANVSGAGRAWPPPKKGSRGRSVRPTPK